MLGLALWVGALVVGIREIVRYETTAGAATAAPESWPSESQIAQIAGFTLVMFVHPECRCTRASLGELAAIAAARDVTIDIVFDRARGDMWDAAGRVRSARRFVDDGTEAARFGAKTSGFVVVFDRTGLRRFAGGITGSRGHAGSNVGRIAVERLLAGEASPADDAVFGCPVEAS